MLPDVTAQVTANVTADVTAHDTVHVTVEISHFVKILTCYHMLLLLSKKKYIYFL